jgi:hypothetical protein
VFQPPRAPLNKDDARLAAAILGLHYQEADNSCKEPSLAVQWYRKAMIRLGLAALLLAAAPAVGADRPFRYVAKLADGQRVESDRLTNWHLTSALPQLGAKPLLDSANPMHWLRNRSSRLGDEPAACVEMTNGDRLPGTVVDYRSGAEQPYRPLPPHLIVRVSVDFEPPDNKPVPEIRVATQFVRRIVWQRTGRGADPKGVARYRDGRSLVLRAVRLKSGAVHILSPDGEQQASWNELSELCFPPVDPWSAWFDQLAAVCPTSDTRLIRAETSSGLIATASLATFAARFEGN